MTKRGFSLLLLSAFLVAALVLPGCIDYSISTTIKSDGSGERVVEVIMDESLANMTISGEKNDVEEQLKKSAPKGSSFDKSTKGDKVHYKISYKFKDIDDLKEKNEEMSSEKKEGQSLDTKNIKLEKKDWFVYAKYKFSEEFPPSKNAQQLQLGDPPSVKYKLTMPGKITKASADNTNENTANWSFDLAKGNKIEASSQLVRWNWIIVIGAVVLGLITILLMIIIFTRKPKSKPKSKKAEESEAQPEM